MIFMNAMMLKEIWESIRTRFEGNANSRRRRKKQRKKRKGCMTSNSKVSLGYDIQSNNEVLSYKEEMNRIVFKCTEEDFLNKPLYIRFSKIDNFKGVPHPLTGDYTPKPQEEIDGILNQAKPHVGTSAVTNHAGTLEVTNSAGTPNTNASEEEDDKAEELIIKLQNLKSQEKEASPNGISEDAPDILAFQKELDAIAQNHLGAALENNTTSTPLVNTGSGSVNTGKFDASQHPDPDLPELEIFNRPKQGIFDAASYDEEDMLKKFNLASVKTAITPMETKMALTKDEEADEVDVTPKTLHLNAVKRIFKYLKGKPNLGLWYPRESSFDLEAFSDSDYARANLDRKSITSGCQFLRSRLISWQCKKQTIVATSTIEAEYVAAASCCG
ncbi:hypothetical protein Tco_1530256 [Tanacetum coccineum]